MHTHSLRVPPGVPWLFRGAALLCTFGLVVSCEDPEFLDDEMGDGDGDAEFRVGITNDLDKLKQARGHFDNDATEDIIIAEPTWATGGNSNVGRIKVWYDAASNWYESAESETWHRGVTDIDGDTPAGDYFGSDVAVGDFNNDTYDDIVIAVPGDDESATDSGSIHVIYGSSGGLTASGDQVFHQETTNVPGVAETNDRFGEILAVADFNCDGYSDVAAGAPQEDIGAEADAGAAWVLYGSNTGLTATGSQGWDQDTTNVEGTAEAGDECGSVGVGNFNGDTSSGRECFDFAFGCPGEDIGAVSNAGAVNVLYGGASGVVVTGDQLWHQDVTNIDDTAEANDEFGAVVWYRDEDADGYDELLVRVFEGCEAGVDVHTIAGSSGGLTSAGDSVGCVDPSAVGGVGCSGCVGGKCSCSCSGSGCFGWAMWMLFYGPADSCGSVGDEWSCADWNC